MSTNQGAGDPRPAMPTMKDVASRAGVAVSTVSRVLSGSGYGSESTRQRVLAASSALGYLPSLRARGLRQSRTMTIGIAVPDLGNPVFLEYVRGVEHTAGQAGYAVTICDAQASVEVQERQFERLFADRVDGLVVVPPILSRRGAEPFLRAGVPLEPAAELEDAARVRRHVEATLPAMLEAIRLLQGLGHRRIAYVTRKTPMREASLLGWVDARVHGLRKVGFDFEERYIVRVDTGEDCHAEVRRLEASGEPATAYLVSPYGLAPRLLAAIYDCGLAIPRDVSLVCHGDSDWAVAHRPPLAVIRRDFYAQATRWTRDLLAGIEGAAGEGATAVTAGNLPYEFVPRGSIGPALR
jgi:LacI family repressor for deo operon, udp, cdd, tsx, nupC, and nupG